jgi:hypothetical protein
MRLRSRPDMDVWEEHARLAADATTYAEIGKQVS